MDDCLSFFDSFSRSALPILIGYFSTLQSVADLILSLEYHLKARSRDNDSSILCHDDVIGDDYEIDDYMACMAFKMTIF